MDPRVCLLRSASAHLHCMHVRMCAHTFAYPFIFCIYRFRRGYIYIRAYTDINAFSVTCSGISLQPPSHKLPNLFANIADLPRLPPYLVRKMDLLLAKAICIFTFLSVATFGCSIPYIIGLFGKKHNNEHEKRIKGILSNLNCFGSGFIFSIVMFHLLPETIMIVSSHKDIAIFNSTDPEMKTLYIFFFVFMGFCMQLALEYVLPVDSNLCCVVNDNVKSILDDNFSK
ncbi:transporter protein, putative [Plasmodium ovale wallikeri]|uniref:Transporter protein, putative n=1 Tax=Plasmodium ovale wallikeri TaxID=864142 RepID=A0A1A8Z518_PLAOA|nr:transporter protein, putative [Plasmodium ovale wallikeri]SBT39545.1 transporter protein, putative [Plasmodium ovale wallikeri]